jgi:hypothetical protein
VKDLRTICTTYCILIPFAISVFHQRGPGVRRQENRSKSKAGPGRSRRPLTNKAKKKEKEKREIDLCNFKPLKLWAYTFVMIV